ncbi:MAG TPA: MFS transporter [Chthoniobacterales bacterium]|nr:MFS transporter [Chthoniobacterales bacterium]
MSEHIPKTVQEYIDETPNWSDGTMVADAPMTAMQWRIWMLATAGKFFEGLVVFMTGVALPLIVMEFHLSESEKGMVGAATLFGILVGATALGGLADRVGRKQMFVFEMALFVAFLVLVTFSASFTWLIVGLFGLGLALGCDYPTAHLVISESIPSRSRGQLVLGAFGFQAVGALVGTVMGFLILKAEASIMDWRLMYAMAILPATLVVIGRFFIPQSAHWLMARGRTADAELEIAKLLHRKPQHPKHIRLTHPGEAGTLSAADRRPSYAKLFSKKHRRATILAAVPWFLQDLATYGIGIFTPTILTATIGGASHVSPTSLTQVIYGDMIAAKGAALLDLLLIVGIIGAIILADRAGRIRLQIFGFLGCAVGLFLAAMSAYFDGSMKLVLIFAGFMIFNLMTNLGPNAMTYLIAGEVFPTHIRGMGAGFAASFAKIGAVITAFFFPILLKGVGTATLLYLLVGASLIGALVTWRFGIETKGVNLEKLDTDVSV